MSINAGAGEGAREPGEVIGLDEMRGRGGEEANVDEDGLCCLRAEIDNGGDGSWRVGGAVTGVIVAIVWSCKE